MEKMLFWSKTEFILEFLHKLANNISIIRIKSSPTGLVKPLQLDVNNYPPQIVPKDVKFGVGNGDDLIYLFPLLAGIFRRDS